MAGSYTTIRVKKRHNGLAEVRSYLFDKIKSSGHGIRFEYYDGVEGTPVEVMTIPWEELDRGFITARGIKSKINAGQTFDLVSFKWEDDSQKDERLWMEQMDETEARNSKQMTMFD